MAEQSALATAISTLKEEEVLNLVKQKLEAGEDASAILAECREGMTIVGSQFEEGKFFIPELIFAGSIMKKVMGDLLPRLKDSQKEDSETATVVIGTVRDDIHDIGKDIVGMMLQGTGFRVVDLGVNVTPEQFVEAAKENNAAVIGMSVFLTSCCRVLGETVEVLKKEGLREKISVMIGGAAASDLVAERTGCDFYGETAMDGVNHAVARVKAG